MLNIKLNDNGIHAEASGGGDEIVAELCIVINVLHNTMRKQDALLAAEFRKMLTRAIEDPNSPIWTQELRVGTGFMVTMPRKKEGNA